MVTKRLYEKEKEWSRGQIKTCRKTQHVKIDNMKEMPNSICGNTAVGGNYNSTCDIIEGSVDEIIDGVTKGLHMDHKGLNNGSNIVRGATGFTLGSGKKVFSGIGERYTEALIDGEGFEKAKEKALDSEEIFKDGLEGGVEEGTKYYVGKPVGEEITLKDLEKKDILAKIPVDMVDDPKNWIERGGKIYIDSEDQVTFKAREMKARNTKWIKSQDILFYDKNGKVNYGRSTIDETQEVVGAHFTASKNGTK